MSGNLFDRWFGPRSPGPPRDVLADPATRGEKAADEITARVSVRCAERQEPGNAYERMQAQAEEVRLALARVDQKDAEREAVNRSRDEARPVWPTPDFPWAVHDGPAERTTED